MKISKFLIFTVFILLVSHQKVFAYSVETHTFLTRELVEFYNGNFPERPIPEEFQNEIMKGSRREDDSPRWMNHFYDPVYNRGLTKVPGNWSSSKAWARDSDKQVSALYNPILNTTIADLLAISNPSALKETDFTWERAISDYVQGDHRRAFRGLGQILHLIEDASVPAHTRNDPHLAFNDDDSLGTGSPYEIWTSNFTLESPDPNLFSRLQNKKPIALDNLDEYFDSLATYSNSNFYSKDTVGLGEYQSPEPDYIWRDGKIFYGFRKDENENYYHLVSYKNNPKNIIWAMENNLDLRDKQGDRVLNDYWDRLSVKSIQHGAGVIALFFEEIEKAQNDPNFIKEEPKSFLAQAAEAMSSLINRFFGKDSEADSGLNLTSEFDLNSRQSDIDGTNDSNLFLAEDEGVNTIIENTPAPEKNPGEDMITPPENTEEPVQELKKEPAKENEPDIAQSNENDSAINQAPAAVEEIKPCSFETNQIASRKKLLINEVAWAGTLNSSADEWFELKNISGAELDISGWQILDKAEQIKVSFNSGTKIKNNELFLLERTDDNSVPNVGADVIYTGALSNSNEGLRLFDNQCQLIDGAVADSSWPAGDNGVRRTMERSGDLTWHTYSGDGENDIFGTPKEENSPIPIIRGGSPPTEPSSSDSESLNSDSQNLSVKVLISELQISGPGGSKDEFIELYNPNDLAVDLSGWYLKRKSSSDKEYSLVSASRLDGKSIPAKGYFLLAHADDYGGSVNPDVAWPASYSVSSDNTVVLHRPDKSVSDKLGFGSASDFETSPYSDNPGSGQSLSRKSENDTDNNAADFSLAVPSPNNSSMFGGFIAVQLDVDSSSPASHLVISEVFIDMDGSDNQEFIELYNPADQPIDLTDWSLQYLSGSASTTGKLKKKNFSEDSNIAAKGFYLIGVGGYSGEVAADMAWSQSLNNTGATVFLVASTTKLESFSGDSIIDKIAYGSGYNGGKLKGEGSAASLPPEEQSIERKANVDNSCVSILDEASKFFGNSCDRDNNSKDWETQSSPNPQNTQSFLEPRTAPTVPQDFNVQYNFSNLDISLSWSESQNYSGATSSIVYLLNYATSTNMAVQLDGVSATTTYDKKIDEVGIGYTFSIFAKDRDGLVSTSSATTTLSVSALISNLSFYKDTRNASSTKYLAEFSYNSYPFIPDIYNKGNVWKILVFYLNKEAPGELELNTAGIWQSESLNGVAGIVYGNCTGSDTPRFSLILPDTSGQCGIGGGAENKALHWDNLEDPHLLLELSTTIDDVIFTSQDFLTIGAYSLSDSGGGDQKFKLAALDRNKYYFQNTTPAHQSSSAPANLELSVNPDSSLLRIIWDKSTDADTLDNLITYEINYSTTALSDAGWGPISDASLDPGESSEINSRPFTKVSVEPNNAYNIALRARDDFGNLSSVATTSFTVPDIAPPYGMSNIEWGYINSSSTVGIGFGANTYPFMTPDKTSAIIFFLNQSPPTNHTFSNNDSRWEIGGNNKVLKLGYSTCSNSKDSNLGGLLMSNSTNCPNGGSGLKKNNVRNDFAGGQTIFTAAIAGVLNDGSTESYSFSADDYITIGFYELQGNIFQEASNYNKKIYFSE